ncbi:hypothetical protein FDI98_gp135 [Vibrio phage JSF10]|uniref:Uncharacterized protein n=1 Tax=Vibrio phage JSF10 TaxID=1983593 RepID=A0A2D0Z2V1_9CAUD|nr:hypothetical protein FDI98_gp135 [Vibrio phage JSF10]ASV43397.1 hypothetical protein [Vibrio phage JSF10]
MIHKVITFNCGTLDVDVEENKRLPILRKIIYDECPVCKELAEQDILYHAPGMAGFVYACKHEVHFKDGKDPVYR